MYTYYDRLVIPRLAQDFVYLVAYLMSYYVGHQIGNAPVGNFVERFFWKERFYIVGLQSSFLQLCCLQLFKPDMAKYFSLHPLV